MCRWSSEVATKDWLRRWTTAFSGSRRQGTQCGCWTGTPSWARMVQALADLLRAGDLPPSARRPSTLVRRDGARIVRRLPKGPLRRLVDNVDWSTTTPAFACGTLACASRSIDVSTCRTRPVRPGFTGAGEVATVDFECCLPSWRAIFDVPQRCRGDTRARLVPSTVGAHLRLYVGRQALTVIVYERLPANA